MCEKLTVWHAKLSKLLENARLAMEHGEMDKTAEILRDLAKEGAAMAEAIKYLRAHGWEGL